VEAFKVTLEAEILTIYTLKFAVAPFGVTVTFGGRENLPVGKLYVSSSLPPKVAIAASIFTLAKSDSVRK